MKLHKNMSSAQFQEMHEVQVILNTVITVSMTTNNIFWIVCIKWYECLHTARLRYRIKKNKCGHGSNILRKHRGPFYYDIQIGNP